MISGSATDSAWMICGTACTIAMSSWSAVWSSSWRFAGFDSVCRKPRMPLMTAVKIVGICGMSICTTPKNVSMSVCVMVGISFIITTNKSAAALTMSGSTSLMMPGMTPSSFGIAFWMNSVMLLREVWIAGRRLSMTARIESRTLSMSLPRSASGFAIPVTKSSHDDFIMLSEPLMVCSASSADVPAMPRCSWTTAIAFTILSKLMLFASTLMPSLFISSVIPAASLMSRSISVLVPP